MRIEKEPGLTKSQGDEAILIGYSHEEIVEDEYEEKEAGRLREEIESLQQQWDDVMRRLDEVKVD